jgi:hypothetical protein
MAVNYACTPVDDLAIPKHVALHHIYRLRVFKMVEMCGIVEH